MTMTSSLIYCTLEIITFGISKYLNPRNIVIVDHHVVMLYICCVCRTTRHPVVAMAVLSGTVILLVAGAWLMSMQPAVEAKTGPLITDVVRATERTVMYMYTMIHLRSYNVLCKYECLGCVLGDYCTHTIRLRIDIACAACTS